jgi:hypothetical protein
MKVPKAPLSHSQKVAGLEAVVAASNEAIAPIDTREIAVAAAMKNADETPGLCRRAFFLCIFLHCCGCSILIPGTRELSFIYEDSK